MVNVRPKRQQEEKIGKRPLRFSISLKKEKRLRKLTHLYRKAGAGHKKL